jgi:hypothetical protein
MLNHLCPAHFMVKGVAASQAWLLPDTANPDKPCPLLELPDELIEMI